MAAGPEQSEGFTLIELLVVIAIIGILTSVALVAMSGARASARDAKRQADLYQISNTMELCYDDKMCAGGQRYLVVASPEGPASIGPYMNPVPGDPVNVAPHRYAWSDNSAALSQYCVSTKLEAENVFIAVSEKGTKFNLTAQPPLVLTPTTSCW